MIRPGRLIRPALMLVAWGLAVPATAPAQTDRETLVVQAAVADHPALDESLRKAVRDRVVELLAAVTGRAIDWRPAEPQVAALLLKPDPGRLTPATFRNHHLDQAPQTLLLLLGYDAGTYRVRAAGYDRDFGDVTSAGLVSLVQRDAVPEVVARLLRRAWHPVGRLVSADEGNFRIRFARGVSSADLGLGTALEVIRSADGRRGRQLDGYPDDFLAVTNVSSGQVSATVAVPPYRATRFFAFVTNSRASYLARVVRPGGGTTTIRIVAEPKGQPRDCCAVFVSDSLPATDQYPRGLPSGYTNDAGEFSLPPGPARLRYVTVALGHQYLTRAVAGGGSENPVTIRLPRLAPQSGFARDRQRVMRIVRNANDRLALLQDKAVELATQGKVDEIEPVLQKLNLRPDFDRMEAEFREIRGRAAAGGIDTMVKQLDKDLALVENFRKNWLDVIAAARDNQHAVIASRLMERYNEAIGEFRWPAALEAIDSLARLRPENRQAVFLRDRLKAGIPARSPAHASARTTVGQLLPIGTVDDLLTRWSQLQRSVRVLIGQNDGLRLTQLAPVLAGLKPLAEREALRLTARLENPGGLAESELRILRSRARDLVKVIKELASLRSGAAAVANTYLKFDRSVGTSRTS